IKKPNAINMATNDSSQSTLLGELLSSNSSNKLILTLNTNANNVNQNLVSKASAGVVGAKYYSNSMMDGNKPSLKCPTLAALISSPNVAANNNSPMLSSAVLNPPITSNTTTLLANNRIRNNSMSTDYSVSSHDEGFASQQEEEYESDDNTDIMFDNNDLY